MSTTSLRWWAALILVEIAPLVLANIVGINPSPTNHDSDHHWGHGWPMTLCWRSGVLHPFPHLQYSGPPLPPFPRSSHLPFDKAHALWRAQPAKIAINVLACVMLLVTGGIACRNSRWVVSGKPQLSLATLLVFLTVASIYLAVLPKARVTDAAVSLIPVPAIVAGILGLREFPKWRRIQSGKSPILVRNRIQ